MKKKSIIQKTFVLFVLLLFSCLQTWAQTKVLTGTVVDDLSDPIPGVSVVIKGTSNGTITDLDGKFSVNVQSNDAVLIFSFIGMATQEVITAGLTTINVVMRASVVDLDEVVAIGYGSLRKGDLTGAITTVSTEGFDRIAAVNPLTAIQGKAAGVQITSGSGMPGSSSNVIIRGVPSVNSNASNSAPIYVVDGVITTNIDNVNPNNIEAISILKDASASAIYGARAANGVIIVTTKRGSKNNKPQISINAYYGWQTESNLKIDLLNADEFVTLWTESYNNAGITLPFSDADVAKYDGVDTDWKKEMMQTGSLENIDISIAGGSEKSNYFIAASNLNQKGMVIETAYKKSTFTINTDHQITDWFKIGNSLSIYASKGIGQGGPQSPYNMALLKVPLTRAYEPDGDYGIILNTDLEHMHQNPLWRSKSNSYENDGKGLQGNLYGTATILKGLDVTARGSVDYTNSYVSEFTAGVPGYYGWEGSSINQVDKSYQTTLHWIADVLVNYETTFNQDHSIKVLLGYSAEENTLERLGGMRTGTPNNEIRYLDAGDPLSQTNFNDFLDDAYTSYFGRLNYNYKNKYLVSATLRRDGTSRLSGDQRFGSFPSVSAAWRISQESFMEDVSFIDDLKLRASVGTLGNVRSLSNYATVLALSNQTASLNQGGVLAFSLTDAVNPFITWESAVKKNFGFDLAAMGNRFYMNGDFFVDDTYDMLFTMPIPTSTGLIGEPEINAGQVRNTGFELVAGIRDKKGDWRYDVSLNVAHVKNEVVDLGGRDLRTSGNVEGSPVLSYFGYKSDGIIRDAGDLAVYQGGPFSKKQIGDIKLLDVDGYDADGKLTGIPDGKVDAADRTIIGNRYPDLTYGGVASLGYKNWNLQMQFQGVHGADIRYAYSTGGAYTLVQLMSSWARNEDARVLQRYDATNNPNGTWPRLDKSSAGSNLEFSDFWLADASYLRINNINLSYSVPKDISSRMGLGALGVYFSVQNAYVFTNYDGPEVDTTADALTGIPQPRTYTLGINASF